MNRFNAQDCHSERIVPGGELSLLGEAEFAEDSGFGLQAQNVEHDLFQAGEIILKGASMAYQLLASLDSARAHDI